MFPLASNAADFSRSERIAHLSDHGGAAVTSIAPDLSVGLSVVVPCYNESESLYALHARVSAACEAVVGDDWEFVLVNDGSRDATWSMMTDLAARDPRVVAVNLSRNHGHQLALSAGLRVCRGQRILIIDADLQDPPELLGKMMKRMDDGADVVYGVRTQREGETVFKKATAAMFYRLLRRVTDIDIPADTGDFRLMSRRALDVLNGMPETHRFIRGMVSWIGMRQDPLPYERVARFAGESKYPLSKMIRFAMDAITGFSIVPLRIATYMGWIVGLMGILALLYVLASWMLGAVVSGWTSITAIVLILGSVQLMVVGVLGEYVGRLYMESKGRPMFVIQDIVRSSPGTMRGGRVRAEG